MRFSQFFIPTTKETPSDAQVISHQLMLRAGMIRALSSGLYSWLPLGLRVLRKVEAVVREEMDRCGAQEIAMPMVQPAALWEQSERWQQYGAELLRFTDRHHNPFCLGPTHEEVVAELVRHDISSYKQLPRTFYQIQSKFRDEIRPRFGVMRAREFLMKDAYSFHLNEASLQASYDVMCAAYTRIFTRLGLDFRVVHADSGAIGGTQSQEFHVLADAGEDAIAFSDGSDFAANVETVAALPPIEPCPAATQALQKVATPNKQSVLEVSQMLGIAATQVVKTLLVVGENDEEATGQSTPLVALILRGDHQLNAIKAEKIAGVAAPLRLASKEQIVAATGCQPGSIGPIGLTLPIIVDHSAAQLADFVCGANEEGCHYSGVNWERDCPLPAVADLRNAVAGDPSPDGEGKLHIKRGIEVGHIFQLGDKYSKALHATVLDEHRREQAMLMGCYGIGISRIVAAAIEQQHDQCGIVWPTLMAPFQIAIAALNSHKCIAVAEQSETLYQALLAAGYEVLLDDRQERPGVKFADIDLIGIPHRIVVSERGLQEGVIEYKQRSDSDSQMLAVNDVVDFFERLVHR